MSRIRRNWTAKEDELLRAAVQRAENESRPLLWRELAKSVPGRSNKDCRRRWWNSLANGHIKGPWAEEEDERLFTAVQKYGMNWSRVATEVGSRNSDQCSSHWSQVLNPNINYCDWAEEEDANLLHEVLTYGTNWATIAGFHSPIRTTLALKNRYSTLRLRNENKKKTRHNETDAVNRRRQSNGVNSVSPQTTQWEIANLSDSTSIKVAVQSDSSKSTGSTNDDDDDDDEEDDSEDDDCDDDDEDGDEAARTEIQTTERKSGEEIQRPNTIHGSPTSSIRQTGLSKMSGAEALEIQTDDCMQFVSPAESFHHPPSSIRRHGNEETTAASQKTPPMFYGNKDHVLTCETLLDLESLLKGGLGTQASLQSHNGCPTPRSLEPGPVNKERATIDLEAKSNGVNFSTAGLMASPTATMEIKIPSEPEFQNLGGGGIKDMSPYSVLAPPWLRQPSEQPLPYSCHYNVSITMSCDQNQVQAIMMNLSHLGTNITINFQRID
ncbi:dna-binding protein [Colletotrichum incanum]|uniref:Dna-binding protein n=1 Tax=Colletotrichum incanum TaxID=1573173 RepID=A0A167AQD2_COLIC|nr:dna-binding protein [Colletotrichum incanum]OHW94714.1 DNA-binding protein [Colletotrichum incanum]